MVYPKEPHILESGRSSPFQGWNLELVSGLNYEEHQLKKVKFQRKTWRKLMNRWNTLLRWDPPPLSWASTSWTISKVNHTDDNVLLRQALHTPGFWSWLLMWVFWGLYLYVLPDISGLNRKYIQDSEYVSQSKIKAWILLVLNKSMPLIPTIRVNQMSFCTCTKIFTIKDTPQGTRLSTEVWRCQHPQV